MTVIVISLDESGRREVSAPGTSDGVNLCRSFLRGGLKSG